MTSAPSQRQNYSKLVGALVAAVVIVAIIVVVIAVGLPKLQQAVNPTPSPTPAPAAYFTFPSQSTRRTSEGGILGIGANVVVWIDVTVKNSGTAAGGCTVFGEVTDANGSYWTQSQGVYLQVGQEQSISLKFASGPHNDAYTWSVSTG